MLDYQKRVVTERDELEAKLEKLIEFLHGDFYKERVEADEKARLERQFEAMTAYLEVLNERIIHFGL